MICTTLDLKLEWIPSGNTSLPFVHIQVVLLPTQLTAKTLYQAIGLKQISKHWFRNLEETDCWYLISPTSPLTQSLVLERQTCKLTGMFPSRLTINPISHSTAHGRHYLGAHCSLTPWTTSVLSSAASEIVQTKHSLACGWFPSTTWSVQLAPIAMRFRDVQPSKSIKAAYFFDALTADLLQRNGYRGLRLVGRKLQSLL